MMERLTREMTFEEEYIILQKEVKELFDKEDRESEPPKSNCVVRRALRCIKMLVSEVEQYKDYKDAEEKGLLLRLPCKVGDTVYQISENFIEPCTIETISLGNYVDRNGNYCNIAEIYYDRDDCPYVSTAIYFTDIGETVFLTQAEAEQKLKEMKNK